MSLSALPSDERQIIDAILDAALGGGFVVSVYDGEEWALAGSDSRPAIAREIGATDLTTLLFRDPASRDGRGKPALVGSVLLVHGNGSDVIGDYSDDEAMAGLLAPALAVADRLSAVL